MHRRQHAGPGIAKVRHPHPLARRVVSLARTGDAYWAWLLERADIVSEGGTDQEGSSLVYRGTSSILLSVEQTPFVKATRRHGDGSPAPTTENGSVAADFAALAALDPHLRLRVVRIAHREAQVRAPGSLGPSHVDIIVSQTEGGIRVDVEIDAVIEGAMHMRKVRDSTD